MVLNLSMKNSDKRGKERVSIEERVTLTFQNIEKFVTEHADNISLGGMFIKTSNPLPTGTKFNLELFIGGEEKKISGIGEVVWTKEFSSKSDERPSGMGIKFVSLYGKSKAVIKELIKSCPLE